MDPMLPKQVIASVSTHFDTVVSGIGGLQYFVEGIDNVTEETFQNDSVVCRVNGPVLYEGSAAADDEWYLIEIQLLVTDIRQRSEGGYSAHEWCGAIMRALQDPIPIYEYDVSDPGNDVLIGCLEPDKRTRNNIRIADYQIVDRDVPVHQMSVHGRFILCL